MSLGRAGRELGVGLWVVQDADVVPVKGFHFLAGATRALGRFGAPVAGPVEDRRSGRCAGVGVAARLEERSQEELARRVLGAQIAARRRPVVVETVADFDAMAVASDLGVAALLVRAGGRAEAGRWVQWEARRLEQAPLISVLVCAFNAEATLAGCLRSLERLSYPSYEVIAADDGSSDRSRAIANRPGVRVLELEHKGLSAARNAAAREASGEIVAYLDADAEAHPDWLDWLWRGFDRLGADGVSGPNYPFAAAGIQERAVSGAPGAPVPAVNPDGTAHHLPGCSMAFRRQLVLDIGFEEGTGTGEDVLFCDAALARGARLAYHPTAAIDHHRRDTITGYLRQQRAYGETIATQGGAEGLDWDAELEQPPLDTPWSSRLNPFKRRYVFSGAQEQGLYAQREYGVRVALPLRAAKLLITAWLALLAPAWIARRRAPWAAGAGASLTALLLWVAVRVPAFAPPGRSSRGLLQRLLTALLWFGQPIARRIGERRGG